MVLDIHFPRCYYGDRSPLSIVLGWFWILLPQRWNRKEVSDAVSGNTYVGYLLSMVLG